MNNGIFVQTLLDKPSSDIGLPKGLSVQNSVPLPYNYPGDDYWRIDNNKLVLVYDTRYGTNTSITLPMAFGPSYNINIDWGDGNTSDHRGTPQNITYTYKSHGVYIVQISGFATGFGANITNVNANKLIKCLSFGNLPLTSLAFAFQGCSNLIEVPRTIPSTVNTLQNCFLNCFRFNQNIGSWNVSNVNNLSATFYNCSSFNNGGAADIEAWNTSSVTTMSLTFEGAANFNQPLDNWNTSNVTNMTGMFRGASSFNRPIGSWDTSKVINFTNMFLNCINFNNGESDSIKNWNTGTATTMEGMFQGATRFNQPIGTWNTSNVTSMLNMFNTTSANFNQPLNNWNTSNVTNMGGMFGGHTNSFTGFNQDIGSWNVNKVTNFTDMFIVNFAFNNGESPNINNWNINTTSSVNMSRMFYDAKRFNQPLGSWNVSRVTNMSQMFPYAAFDQNISNWNIASVTSLFQIRALGGGFSTSNYDALLIGWNNNKLATSNGVANWNTALGPHFGTSKYTAGGAAAAARAALVTYGWTITDGGIA